MIYINTLRIRSAESALTKYHKGKTLSFCWCLSDLQIHGNIKSGIFHFPQSNQIMKSTEMRSALVFSFL